MISDNILALLNKTPDSILTSIAMKVKERRLERNWRQKFLASKAEMTLRTMKNPRNSLNFRNLRDFTSLQSGATNTRMSCVKPSILEI